MDFFSVRVQVLRYTLQRAVLGSTEYVKSVCAWDCLACIHNRKVPYYIISVIYTAKPSPNYKVPILSACKLTQTMTGLPLRHTRNLRA